MNYFDRFLYKLFILTFIFLFVVVLDKLSITNLQDIKNEINANINFVNVVQTINKDFNIINVEEEIIDVSVNDYKLEEIDNKYKYNLNYNKVYSNCLGSVIKINKNNELYEVYILDENNNIFIFQDLKEIKVKMYEIVKKNEVIGVANENDNNEFPYYYYLKINED